MLRAPQIALVASFVLTASACESESNMDIYATEQIISANVEALDETGVVLAIQPMSETAFFLAGATLTDDGDKRVLQLLRCRVGKTCTVDVKADITPGTPGPYRMRLDGVQTPIDISFKDGSIQSVYTPAN